VLVLHTTKAGVRRPGYEAKTLVPRLAFTVQRLGILCKGTVWSKPKLSHCVSCVSYSAAVEVMLLPVPVPRPWNQKMSQWDSLWVCATILGSCDSPSETGRAITLPLAVHARARLVSVPDPNQPSTDHFQYHTRGRKRVILQAIHALD